MVPVPCSSERAERSHGQAIEATLEAFFEQVRLEQPEAATAGAATTWIKTLLNGVHEHIVQCWLKGRDLHVQLYICRILLQIKIF